MKKIITLFAIIGLVAFSSCEGPEGPIGPPGFDAPLPQAFQINNVDLVRKTNFKYEFSNAFAAYVDGDLFNDETVLIYRKIGQINSATPIWQLIPKTTNFDNGDVVDYFFDFSKVDFLITVIGSFNLNEVPDFIRNQTFRVVIMPSALMKASVNKNNYSEVMSALNIKESQVQNINF
ncbi:hypothetical protein QWY99_13520 [Flavobacterium branchiarum]|uniref:Dihydrolipoamide dehydrogenase n=1 Tax=Flavobacterium branchiarum TaxID=1114870 RepID=A0ABV5FI00_9FLAO|nr:hypothetical protein [Flavobacterium branchiarum]MDN3674075.1 hypothetical protein [Flavobacterium branchiarum]